MKIWGTVICAALCLASVTASGADDPLTRLRQARSLRCSFTGAAVTEFKDGRRAITITQDKGSVVFDDIDLERGTARAIGNVGAGNLTATWQANALWLLLRAPNGNLILTTVFPAYEPGTNHFVVVESRHWAIGQFASGEQDSGSCAVLE